MLNTAYSLYQKTCQTKTARINEVRIRKVFFSRKKFLKTLKVMYTMVYALLVPTTIKFPRQITLHGIAGSNSTQGVNVCKRFFCVCVVLCM
jgi:flagellar biosynthesis protein FlhB